MMLGIQTVQQSTKSTHQSRLSQNVAVQDRFSLVGRGYHPVVEDPQV